MGETMKPGYSEEGDLVVLRMTREDYEQLLLMIGMATGLNMRDEHGERRRGNITALLSFADRLNAGNPRWAPYSA